MQHIRKQAALIRKRGHQDHLANAPPRRTQCVAIAIPGTGQPDAPIQLPEPIVIHSPRGGQVTFSPVLKKSWP
eukprot:3084022-Pyramimonas_sp.AAC.1